MLTETAPQKLPTLGELHLMQRERLTDRHAKLLKKILKKNLQVSKYWIMGTVETVKVNGRTKITPKMEALFQMPQMRKEAYLYEVDNTKGTHKLLWVMHPNNKLSLPGIGKSICVADKSGV